MQYSPRNAIMYVSLVDAGTVELLRELGKTIVSSADLVSRFEAVRTSDRSPATTRHRSHRRDRCRGMEADRRGCAVNEYEVVVWLQEAMRRAGSAEARTQCLGEREQLRLALRSPRPQSRSLSATAISF